MSDDLYFSERKNGVPTRTKEEITPTLWTSIKSLIEQKIDDVSFGKSFSEMCIDNQGVFATSVFKFYTRLASEVPKVVQDTRGYYPIFGEQPDTEHILDLIEFCWKYIAGPKQRDFHTGLKHPHFEFDVEAGRQAFVTEINIIFRCSGLMYELDREGKVHRIPAGPLRDLLKLDKFKTGDDELDKMLFRAREKFLSPKITDRKEALEKLWDAWERIKTLENPDKKLGIQKLISKASLDSAKVKDLLDKKSSELTKIGNTFFIRHKEKTQTNVNDSAFTDFLFHQMFSLIHYLLVKTKRV